MSKITSGSLVQFKPSYTGYFKDLLGKTLTVNQVLNRETRYATDSDKVALVNIDELHLISVEWLDLVQLNSEVLRD